MVEITYLAIAGIAIAAMFFGYGFGLFEGRGQGYKKRKSEEGQEKKDQPVPLNSPVTVTVDDPGLMRIKNENGLLTLDLDGARVNTSSFSADQRKRLIEMLNLMRPWLEGKPPSAPITPPPSPAIQPTPFDPAQGKPVPAMQSYPAVTPASPPPAQQAVGPSLSRPLAAKAPTIAKEDRPSAPSNSMVSQIDAILQERVAGTPLEDSGVFLTQSPEGGVNVYVGLTRYMGIDDVPDAEIKAAIRAAISEWENKYTPGLK